MESENNTKSDTTEGKLVLETKGLNVGYEGGKTILENVDLSIFAGSITSIVGQNGTGKSTLLKSIARQLKPHAGEIKLKGSDIWELTNQSFSKQCSYLPQFLSQNTSLTVEELVALGRNPHQKWWSWNASSHDLDAINSAMERANVTSLKSRYLSTLSGGEKQRALIAQALAQQSEVILLDEPIASLDFKHQLSVIQLLNDLRESNMAIVVVLHDLNIIDHISDKVVLIESQLGKSNKIAKQGKPLDVLSNENIKEYFDVYVSIIPASKNNSSARLFNMFG